MITFILHNPTLLKDIGSLKVIDVPAVTFYVSPKALATRKSSAKIQPILNVILAVHIWTDSDQSNYLRL